MDVCAGRRQTGAGSLAKPAWQSIAANGHAPNFWRSVPVCLQAFQSACNLHHSRQGAGIILPDGACGTASADTVMPVSFCLQAIVIRFRLFTFNRQAMG
jgi:hypothetical protein